MQAARIVIVTPSLAEANNGNWQTARRWAALLQPAYRVRVALQWEDGDEDLMVALHARRSAASIAMWQARRPGAPLLLALTGTDLYRDIDVDDAARASLLAATRLVVLNQRGCAALPAALRARCRVVLQSCSARSPLARSTRHLRALTVGHLREEKSPATVFEAMRLLADRPDIRMDHVGAALDPALGALALALADTCPAYRWLGGLPHGATRRRIQAAHVLVHPSRMEGGAHVVIEALRSGTPVLASRVDGNVGLLGPRYAGYFAPGDAAELAWLLRRLRDEPARLQGLAAQGAARQALFEPAAERAALRAVAAECLAPASSRGTPRHA